MYGCVEIGRLVSDWRGLYVICATCIDSSMAAIRREPPNCPFNSDERGEADDYRRARAYAAVELRSRHE
jgi:hypothetical protein